MCTYQCTHNQTHKDLYELPQKQEFKAFIGEIPLFVDGNSVMGILLWVGTKQTEGEGCLIANLVSKADLFSISSAPFCLLSPSSIQHQATGPYRDTD